MRRAPYDLAACPVIWQGSSDFLFTALPALTGSSIGVSFQSANFPQYYLSVIQSNTLEGSLRLGVMDPAAALDNATWLVVPGRAGGFNTYSLQARDISRILLSPRSLADSACRA